MTDRIWIDIGRLEEIPRRGARVLKFPRLDIAVFRTEDDKVFALEDRCPHKNGPLSQGIVHGHNVACPLHDWVIDLMSGEAQGADKGCARVMEVKLEEGRLYLCLEALGQRAA